MHSEVQREIREHDQTGCEAEPPDRHLIAKNIRIEHLKSGPPGLETQHRTKGIRVLQGARRQAANVRFGSKADIEAPSFDVRFTPKSGHQNSAAKCPLCAKSGHQFGLEDKGSRTL